MIISSKGKYAMRLMLELGNYYKGEPVKIKDIAKRQNISDKYLEQIVAFLNKAGLVKSVRGAKGGYILAYAPDKYTVSSILRSVEGDLSAVDYGDEASSEDGNREVKACNKLWEQLDDSISLVLDKVTLADLMEWESEYDGSLNESCWI